VTAVREAYAEALAITRREAKNFGWGIALLPRPKREAIAALYAFARRVDDIADDGSLAVDDRRGRLEECRAAASKLPAAPDDDPVLVALGDAMSRHEIPQWALLDLVDGGLMDVEWTRYATWEELREYCRRVAGSVGVGCAAVYRPADPERARPLAETLGIALQQINIMRDVAEDWRLGRIYLPQDELERCGVTESAIAEARLGPGWRALMELQAQRAESLLHEGLGLLDLLDRRSRLCVRTFAGIYRGLLAQMSAREYDVFSSRPHLSTVAKARAVAAL
jgi:15-cis-phytoene synthase